MWSLSSFQFEYNKNQQSNPSKLTCDLHLHSSITITITCSGHFIRFIVLLLSFFNVIEDQYAQGLKLLYMVRPLLHFGLREIWHVWNEHIQSYNSHIIKRKRSLGVKLRVDHNQPFVRMWSDGVAVTINQSCDAGDRCWVWEDRGEKHHGQEKWVVFGFLNTYQQSSHDSIFAITDNFT